MLDERRKNLSVGATGVLAAIGFMFYPPMIFSAVLLVSDFFRLALCIEYKSREEWAAVLVEQC